VQRGGEATARDHAAPDGWNDPRSSCGNVYRSRPATSLHDVTGSRAIVFDLMFAKLDLRREREGLNASLHAERWRMSAGGAASPSRFAEDDALVQRR
jgi:hypothetical protein